VFAFSLADVFDAEGPVWPKDRPLPGKENGHLQGLAGLNTAALDVFFHTVVKTTPNLDWLILTKRFERAQEYMNRLARAAGGPWKNVWLIFSAGSQKALDHAAPILKDTAAVIRGISAEPLLGDMDFGAYLGWLDWVIVGGESGAEAREMRPEWEEKIRLQCQGVNVPYFLKQLGQRWGGRWNKNKLAEPAEWADAMRLQEFPVYSAVK
jgi:protein gp37